MPAEHRTKSELEVQVIGIQCSVPGKHTLRRECIVYCNVIIQEILRKACGINMRKCPGRIESCGTLPGLSLYSLVVQVESDYCLAEISLRIGPGSRIQVIAVPRASGRFQHTVRIELHILVITYV